VTSEPDWLNGWSLSPHGTKVIMGSGVYCSGCGMFEGTTSVVILADWKPPAEHPDWPYARTRCPVCYLRSQLR
jgi:hypothetical protein